MYNGIFDEKHQIFKQPFTFREVHKREVTRAFDGEYEGELLCEKCDNEVIGQYETYAGKVMYGGDLKANECPVFSDHITGQGNAFIKVSKINYLKYKLFLLSVLWRASISTRPIFNEVKLDQVHENEIRRMIYEGDPGTVSDYPIFVYTYRNNHDLTGSFIGQPRILEETYGRRFIFPINGYFYWFYEDKSSGKIPVHVPDHTIRPTNELNLNVIPDDKVIPFIHSYFNIKEPF